MPTVVESTAAVANPGSGIAAAIVNVGQNAMLNASTLAGTSAAVTLGLPDLTGMEVPDQARGHSLRFSGTFQTIDDLAPD